MMRFLRWLFGCWHKWDYFLGRPRKLMAGDRVAVDDFRYRKRQCLKCHRVEYRPIDLMAPNFRGKWTEAPTDHIASRETVMANYERQKAATARAMEERQRLQLPETKHFYDLAMKRSAEIKAEQDTLYIDPERYM